LIEYRPAIAFDDTFVIESYLYPLDEPSFYLLVSLPVF